MVVVPAIPRQRYSQHWLVMFKSDLRNDTCQPDQYATYCLHCVIVSEKNEQSSLYIASGERYLSVPVGFARKLVTTHVILYHVLVEYIHALLL
jgi:hypothetical protein